MEITENTLTCVITRWLGTPVVRSAPLRSHPRSGQMRFSNNLFREQMQPTNCCRRQLDLRGVPNLE